jgi:hypothetical protein
MGITLTTLQNRLATMIGDKDGIYDEYYTDAINNAAREQYPALFKPLVDETLITGNILPPLIWSSTSALNFYSSSNATLAKTTTGGLYRNGLSSAKATASAADGYLYLSSDNYPRLLDQMGYDVTFKCWVYPSTADDAFLTIYTVKADGTAQTLNSTTTCPASKFTLLELEDQTINDDIVDIEFRMRVHTSGQNAYFDPPRAIGRAVYDYILPTDFQDGVVSQVGLQTTSYSDDACDDLHPHYAEEFGWKIINDGSYKYLRLPYAPTASRRIKLIGYCPLESNLSSGTDTMTIEDKFTPKLLTYAAYLLYGMVEGTPSSDDVSRYERASLKWLQKSELLKNKRMTRPPGAIHWEI